MQSFIMLFLRKMSNSIMRAVSTCKLRMTRFKYFNVLNAKHEVTK